MENLNFSLEVLEEFEEEWIAGGEPAVALAEELEPELPPKKVEFEGLLAGVEVQFEELLVGTEVELEELAVRDTEEEFVADAETTDFEELGAEATRAALEEVLAGGGVEYT